MARREKINLFNYEERYKEEENIKVAAATLINSSNKIVESIGMDLDILITKLEKLITAEQLIRTDTFYNIAWDRGYKIEKAILKDGYLVLKLPPVSVSEQILRAYEEDKNIKPTDFLLLELPETTKNIWKNSIDTDPNITSLEILTKFRIFDYPNYHAFAYAKTEEELLNILELLKKFDKIAKANLIDINDKMFNGLSASRKKRRKKEITPGCFDGMCIEKNTKTTPLFARETNF